MIIGDRKFSWNTWSKAHTCWINRNGQILCVWGGQALLRWKPEVACQSQQQLWTTTYHHELARDLARQFRILSSELPTCQNLPRLPRQPRWN